jgi:hypothetical protein
MFTAKLLERDINDSRFISCKFRSWDNEILFKFFLVIFGRRCDNGDILENGIR